MPEEGRYASISEMAAAEKLDRGYLGRILQLTLLAPDIVEEILDGRHTDGVGLPRLMEPFPAGWSEQRQALLGARAVRRKLHVQPPLDGRHDMVLLGGGQCPAGGYAVPLGQATPAARGSGVLGDEPRVPTEGRPLPNHWRAAPARGAGRRKRVRAPGRIPCPWPACRPARGPKA
jgi:hypothetical protein